MNCPICDKRMLLAKTIRLRSGRVLNIHECRHCGHARIEALDASA